MHVFCDMYEHIKYIHIFINMLCNILYVGTLYNICIHSNKIILRNEPGAIPNSFNNQGSTVF